MTKQMIEFSHWHIDIERGIITDREDSSESKLPHKAMRVLIFLIERAGQTVTKEELINDIWKGNALVGEQGVSNALWRIRKILEVDTSNPQYIETIPKVGYRWIGAGIKDNTKSTESPSRKKLSRLTRRHVVYIAFGLVSLILLAVGMNLQQKASSSEKDFQVHSASNHFGLESFPAISDDGKQMLFSWRKGGRKDTIYLSFDKNKEPIPLTDGKHNDIRPVWLPDNEHFVFLRRAHKSNRCTIVLFSLYSREEESLTECSLTGTEGYSLSVSPDGNYIAYNLTDQVDGESISRINVYSIKDKSIRTLVSRNSVYTDVLATWHPNQKSIYFVRRTSADELRIMSTSVKGGSIQYVTDNVSPDIKRIQGLTFAKSGELFIAGLEKAPGNADIFRWVKDERSLKRIDTSPHHLKNPWYDSANERLYFVEYIHSSHLGKIDLSNEKIITSVQPFVQTFKTDLYPTYCTGVDRVVFVSNASGEMNLWSSAVDGSDIKQLTSYDKNSLVLAPQCSPDGRYVAFTGVVPEINPSREWRLYVYDRQLHNTVALSIDQETFAPSWGATPDEIYSVQDGVAEPTLWLSEFRQSGKFNNLGLPFAVIKWNPVGEGLFASNFAGEIWHLPSLEQGDNKVRMIDNVDEMDWGNWDVTDEHLVYLHRTLDNDEIILLDLKTKVRSTVARLPYGTIHSKRNMTVNLKAQQLVVGYYAKRVSRISYIQM
ncbi:winged helix-turn-helix domain-containing protein [Pleionea sp. CnH1-48]|uniref:winged helix-turn-helix domain-containing protein n=1 Tax=Pleionea sp. CnH1-48 TaxID=2954494 RepID=UPI0020972890|nr:winged helix-turn-helix domain-containing protein [Pleionea sp. CnH1-48]MCO7224897.1 winged helix-turn-helix domain-containing protein [Pleionea sp. CnH1-48]